MNIVQSLINYLRSSKTELEKVSWPSRQDTIRYSSLVLGVSVIVAVFFASLDFGLNRLVDAALQSRVPAQEQTAPAPTDPTAPAPVPSGVPGLDLGGSGGTIVPVGDVTTEAPKAQ